MALSHWFNSNKAEEKPSLHASLFERLSKARILVVKAAFDLESMFESLDSTGSRVWSKIRPRNAY